MTNAKLMQGNEACTLGALAAGLDFFAGYPITPSTEIAELCAEELPKIGGRFIQMEDEIGSIAAIIGASLTGRKVMTATSGPGFSLMQENLGYAGIAEVPIVIVNVQRVGPSTGQPTSPSQGDVMQSRWGTHGDHPVVVLAPGNVKECYELTFKAFNIAEQYRVPVIVLMDEVIGHMREKVILPDIATLRIVNRKEPETPAGYLPYEADDDGGVPLMARFGQGYRFHVTGLFHDDTGFPSNKSDITNRFTRRLLRKVEKAEPAIREYFTESTDDCDILVVAFGSSAMSSLSAVRKARASGIKAGLFRPKTIWPFPEDSFKELAAKAKRVIVPEMNLGQLVLEIERLVGCKAPVERLSKVNGELFKPEEILSRIMGGAK
ncbi:MAG: 2-oxoacid:acceptor oxidoreductase subunit alpha [Spirochaetales bacterium]|nr:MAG: 2-oxoacid:acceptor oxidoreductase subunit alpha [Spirochaetales bacterium]